MNKWYNNNQFSEERDKQHMIKIRLPIVCDGSVIVEDGAVVVYNGVVIGGFVGQYDFLGGETVDITNVDSPVKITRLNKLQ